MSLFLHSNTSVGSYNNPISSVNTTLSTLNIAVVEHAPSRISSRTTEFISAIAAKFLKSGSHTNYSALKNLIQLVSREGVAPIQDALLKKNGYLTRWFSNESWQEWSQYRTPLGRVVSMYCDHINTSQKANVSICRLDKELLEIANRDAAAILNSLRAEKDSSQTQCEMSTRSFWSTFMSLPMAEGAHLGKRGFPAKFELSSLDGTNGFLLDGESPGDNSGISVSNAGDMNADGIADLAVGAWRASPGGRKNAGKSYVIFGSNKGWGSPLNLSSLTGPNGFIFIGEVAGDNTGYSVSSAGDINGDGINDLVVGGNYNPNNGNTKCYVIFGSKAPWKSPLEHSSLNGNNGFTINGGILSDSSRFVGSGIGDVNGDGIDDLIIGAYNSNFWAGRSYVIYGSKSSWNSTLDLSNIKGVNGFVLNGQANDYSGSSVSGAGDINGDGIADFIVGAPGVYFASQSYGRTYVIFGSKAGWKSPFELSSINGFNGFILNGEAPGDFTGSSVSAGGDINGDGIADLIVGAIFASPNNKTGAGKTFVIFGARRGWWSSPMNLSSLNGANGFILNGEAAGDSCGGSVSGAGDINGDGISDLIVGASDAFPTNKPFAGKSYVIFGSKAGWNSRIELSSLNGINGFILNGEDAYDNSGSSVSGAGDINGDGIDDIVVGAPVGPSPNNETRVGKTYVIFGQKAVSTNNAGKFSIN